MTPRAHVTWAKGGSAELVSLDGEAATFRSEIPSPPGSRLDGRTARGTAIRLKLHASKRQDDGTFVLAGRLLDFTRDARAELASLLAPPFEIREATVDDVVTIAALIRELATYEKLEGDVVFDVDALREHLFGARRFAEVLVAEVGGDVVGFALYFHSFSTFLGRPGLYLEDLFVRPEQRGLGIGKSLLVRLAEIAVARGCGRLEWSVLDWNAPAIGFYTKLGARPMDAWTVFRLDGDALAELGRGAPSRQVR